MVIITVNGLRITEGSSMMSAFSGKLERITGFHALVGPWFQVHLADGSSRSVQWAAFLPGPGGSSEDQDRGENG